MLFLLNRCPIAVLSIFIIIVAGTTTSSAIRPFALAATVIASGDSSDGDASLSRFVGEWKLKEIWDDKDDNDKPIKLPSTDDGKPFILTFDGGRPNDDNINGSSLNVYMKIGNSMRTSVTFLGNDHGRSSKIKVGLVMSSRMYPGEELINLENYLSQYLPQMTSIEVNQSQSLLIMTTATTDDENNDNGNDNDNGSEINNGSGRDDRAGRGRQAKIICEAIEGSET